MARIRTLKPEFWKHEQLSALPEPTHMLAAALLNYADDEGYFNANPGLIKAECSPLREPSVSIQTSLKSLEKIGYVEFGVADDGRALGRVVKFSDHQNVNRPTRSKIKCLVGEWRNSPQAHASLTEHSSLEQGTGNREQGKKNNSVAEYDDDFLALWNAWPQGHGPKGTKSEAFKAWQKLRDRPPVEQIIGAAQAQAREKTSQQRNGVFSANFKHMCRWLKHREWENDTTPPVRRVAL